MTTPHLHHRPKRKSKLILGLRWTIQILLIIYLFHDWRKKVANDVFENTLLPPPKQQDMTNTMTNGRRRNIKQRRLIVPLRTQVPKPIDDKKRIMAFIHIGKTAGSTISSILRNGCHEGLKKPCIDPDTGKTRVIVNESDASKRIKSYYHTRKIPNDKYTTFIISTRNPIDRFISAFKYEHPKNMAVLVREDMAHVKKTPGTKIRVFPPRPSHRVRYKCFPSLEEFVLALVDQSEMKTVQGPKQLLNCTHVALMAAAGREEYMAKHLYWNYQRYMSDIPDDKEIFLIRQEHIWKDWIRFNEMLGMQRKDVHTPHSMRKRDSKELPLKGKLSREGRAILCEFLKDEILEYVNLINRAVNLSNNDVDVSLEEIARSCPTLFDL